MAKTRNKQEELTRYCWEQGLLAWMLHGGQEPIYAAQCALKKQQVFVTVTARQFGKTLGEIVYLDEYARRNPGSIIRFAAPTQEMAKVIVLPVWREVMEGLGHEHKACPQDLRPRHLSTESCWAYPNGSRVYLAGTDINMKRLRGSKANLAVVDEAGFHDKLEEVVDSVLGPQLDSTRGNMLMSSTPPPSLSHPFVEYWEQAKRDGLCITKTIFDNPMRTADDIRAICKRANPKADDTEIDAILQGKADGSPAWQREYLCRMVTDRDLRVVRDFDHLRHVRDLPRPHYFQPYTFLDFGFQTDYSAAVFCYLDYRSATLVIEDELLVRRKNSRELVQLLVAKERALWSGNPRQAVRYADSNSAQQIFDMQSIFNYPVSPCSKAGGIDGMVNSLNELFSADRINVHPRCRSVIEQLRDGIWKRDRLGLIAETLKFERNEAMGHLDLIAALMYGARAVDWRRNPTPQGMINTYEQFYLPSGEAEEHETTRRLNSLFGFDTGLIN